MHIPVGPIRAALANHLLRELLHSPRLLTSPPRGERRVVPSTRFAFVHWRGTFRCSERVGSTRLHDLMSQNPTNGCNPSTVLGPSCKSFTVSPVLGSSYGAACSCPDSLDSQLATPPVRLSAALALARPTPLRLVRSKLQQQQLPCGSRNPPGLRPRSPSSPEGSTAHMGAGAKWDPPLRTTVTFAICHRGKH